MSMPCPHGRRRVLAVLVAPLLGGCALLHPAEPPLPVALPPGVQLRNLGSPKGEAIAPELPPPAPGEVLSMPRVLSLALAHSPQTRSAWAQARAAAAGLGVSRSAYYPALNLSADAALQRQPVNQGKLVFQQASAGPAANLSWLILDFGGRSSDVAAAELALLAASYQLDASIQDTLLRAEQAYYQLVTAGALAEAQRATVSEAEAALAAASDRRAAGVATIADVLQAKTAASQARLALQGTEAQREVARGTLAELVGARVDHHLEVASLPEQLPVGQVAEQAAQSLKDAEALRPDLARARALAQAQAQRARGARARAWPSLSLAGSVSRSYYLGADTPPGDGYAATLTLAMPLFDGFKIGYAAQQAEEQAAAAAADAETLAEAVAIDVWSSYQTLQSAALQLETARDLLASAGQLAEVAMGRYRTGTGSILELLTAQASLANARASEVQARANWLFAVVRLAHSTGKLGLPPPAGGPQR